MPAPITADFLVAAANAHRFQPTLDLNYLVKNLVSEIELKKVLSPNKHLQLTSQVDLLLDSLTLLEPFSKKTALVRRAALADWMAASVKSLTSPVALSNQNPATRYETLLIFSKQYSRLINTEHSSVFADSFAKLAKDEIGIFANPNFTDIFAKNFAPEQVKKLSNMALLGQKSLK